MNEWTCDECKHKDVSVDSYPCEACYGGSLYEPAEGSEDECLIATNVSGQPVTEGAYRGNAIL